MTIPRSPSQSRNTCAFGATRITLDTAEEIPKLVTFYRDLGYDSTGRFKHTLQNFWSLWFERTLATDRRNPGGARGEPGEVA